MKNFNAIQFLYPDAVFSMVNDNPNQITWVGQEFPIPTDKQLTNAIQAMEDEEEAATAAKADAKASAIAKLEALGLSAEEIAAITNN